MKKAGKLSNSRPPVSAHVNHGANKGSKIMRKIGRLWRGNAWIKKFYRKKQRNLNKIVELDEEE
jgi:hypothetical protein